MSDIPQGPDWWRASNGLYYPPEARPGPTDSDAPKAGAPEAVDGDEPPASDQPWHPTEHLPYSSGLEPEPEPARGRRWIVVAIIVLLAAVGVGVVVWISLDDDDDASGPADEPVTTTQPADDPGDEPADEPISNDESAAVSVFDLAVGDCFATDEMDGGDGVIVRTVEIVDCTEPHNAVIYDTGSLDTPLGEPFPGTDDRDEASKQLCEPGFETYVGVPLSASELVLLWLAPTEESWADDDREVACAVSAPDGELLTELVAGSGR